MKLPQASEAIVPRTKVEDYLLNPGHPVGRDKARFFFHFGFRREEWRTLAAALHRHAQENEADKAGEDSDGVTWLVEGPLVTPSGRTPLLRSIWLLEAGELAPRFITAYPLEP